jgi:TPR repeat protein
MGKWRLVIFVILCFGWVGSSWAGFSEGLAAYDKGDYKTAFNEFKPLAQLGHDISQNNLGVMYGNGEGVLQNDKEAAKWYRLAAEQGYSFAQYNLALAHYDGKGVLQNNRKAAKWYRLSALQGHAEAQINLGIMYRFGEGVLQNYILSHMWLNLAAYNGMTDAKELRQFIADKMNANQITEAQKLAQQCLDSNYKGCG